MKIGSTFPQTTAGTDPLFIRDYAQAIEGLGYDYLLAYEHVVGAHRSRFDDPPFPFRPGHSGVTYTHETPWHEPLTLYAHLMAVTSRLEFVTSVLILPQRQTVLVAKQVAELQVLSGNRLRLAVGIGWNFTEYESLGVDWRTRARRIEEQIQVLRLLWGQDLVDFEGEFHHLDRVGINPRPARMPEIWYASSGRDVVLDRVARLCDGWMPLLIPPEEPKEAIDRLHAHLRDSGRDIASFGIDARPTMPRVGGPKLIIGEPPHRLSGPERFVDSARQWKALGATHFLLGPGTGDPSAVLKNAEKLRDIYRDEIGG